MSPAATFLVDEILPVGTISLVAGSSGAGKTRWLMPALDDWRRSQDFLCRTSHPVPFAILTCDRPRDSTLATITGMGLDPSGFEVQSFMDSNLQLSMASVEKLFDLSQIELLVIESAEALVPRGKLNDYHGVLAFLREGYHFCKRHHLTILATVHPPKMKQGEHFTYLRDNVLGSVAWANCAETIFHLAPTEPTDPNCSQRTLTLLPRNSPSEEFGLDFDAKGRLVVGSDETDIADVLLRRQLEQWPFDKELPRGVMDEWALKHRLTRRTIDRWAAKLIHDGQLERPRKGIYVRRRKA